MIKPTKRAELVKALLANGCTRLRDRGDHEVFACPCGKHMGPVPRHREITAGVCRSLIKQLSCLPEGWMPQ
ncbi:type II toxin-antitoxin system HicA family toxin [Nocardioides jejuensis]|uniref:Type II toxin-antitoxin system HicA family toxin n=1 Tax=Nocardioides jejuensis TaxID=2502782 RepID=A0A4R1CAY7_9ACTN|nr:type II toxin-antitoxin system HicA family toxin [Nocardioides jejuensis]TCJ20829.1 type II toxin-antitoxin system HicA family toxin [Nocardioides jejuensis]TCJ23008.1 type II toxin-antitoxin system HicA family toxin [Nocardioides jejuensis]TCJ28020.1 type II toxin-antitoxin system HicA family toxin [Nocardioides jejuensis]